MHAMNEEGSVAIDGSGRGNGFLGGREGLGYDGAAKDASGTGGMPELAIGISWRGFVG